MINKNSSIGYVEDKIGALTDSVAKEYHLKILIDKYDSLLNITREKYENSEGDEQEKIKMDFVEQNDKLVLYNRLLMAQTALRRMEMASLKEYSDEIENANETHCLLKHSIGEMIKNFEVYQATENQKDYQIYLKSLEMLNEVIIIYFGYDIPACSSCISDMLKEI